MTDNSPRLTGVSPVLEVPFDPAGRVDVDSFHRVVAHVLGTGVDSVMFPGYASEFHKLTDDERVDLRDVLLATTSAHGVPAIISVPDHATVVAVRRAVDAAHAGAAAINLLPPHLLGPAPDAVRAHIGAVADAVAPLPVVLQVAPAQTGTSLDPAVVAALARRHPNLRYVKVEAVPPGPFITALGATDPALPAFVGYAGLHLPDALRRGAAGVQPGCSFTELYVAIWRHWHGGAVDEALALHTRMLPYLSYWMQGVELIVAAEKLISARRGLIDHPTCRDPARRLDAEEVTTVDRFLAEFADLLPPVR
ncbi:dihydrodipicolinate synthase family protein [Micromonospora sp. NPDC049240]|uniref:dihydrodipicolinate synthase family protein n=1 Tax=Micromonospora sp. NPDC049240 TaxID=3155151 RepID=UPI0033CE6BE6